MTKTRHTPLWPHCLQATVLLALLSACSADTDEPLQTAEAMPVPLAMTAHMDGEAETADTRAASNLLGSQWVVGETFDVYIVDKTSPTTAKGYTTYPWPLVATVSNATTGAVTFKSSTTPYTPYWPANQGNIDVWAWHPTGFAGSMSNGAFTTGDRTFAVKTDQSGNDNYKASDLMFGKPKGGLTNSGTNTVTTPTAGNPVSRISGKSPTVPLLFGHSLSCVCIELKSSGTGEELKQATVKLKNVRPGIKVASTALTTGTVTSANINTSVAATEITVLKGVDNTTGYAIIPPQNINSGTDFINVTLASGFSYTYSPTKELKHEAGMIYTYTLTLLPGGITMKVTVKDWTNGGTVFSDSKVL